MGSFVKGIYGATDATGWAHYTGGAPAGTIICVSSAGSDAGGVPGTFLQPFKTLPHAGAKLQSLGNGEHWLLLRKGDTFVSDGTTWNTFGSPAWTVKGTSPTNPIVISSYDGSIDPATSGFNPTTGGARPLVTIVGASADRVFCGFNGANGGTNTAIIGISVYGPNQDIASSTFNPNGTGEQAVKGIFVLDGWFSDFYIEDCKFNFVSGGVDVDTDVAPLGVAPTYATNLTIRRCQLMNAPFGVDCTSIHGVSSGMVFEENFLFMGGWNSTLNTPQTCSITNASPAVVSWLGSFLSPLINDQPVLFTHSAGGSLPTGITDALPLDGQFNPAQVYYVKNYTPGSPPTFNIATSPGGASVNTSSSGSGTPLICWYYKDNGYTGGGRLHNTYLQGDIVGGFGVPAIVRGNITAYDPGGFVNRQGFTCDNNLALRCVSAFETGAPNASVSAYSMSNNVVLEAAPAPTVPNPTSTSFGLGLLTLGYYNFVPFNTKPITISGNIIANQQAGCTGPSLTIGAASDGDLLSNNIVYNVNGVTIDYANSVVKTVTLVTAGSGGTGEIANFYTNFTSGSGGVIGGPYTIALTGSATGSGATLQVTVTDSGGGVGFVAPSTSAGGGSFIPPFCSDITTHSGADWGSGGWKLINHGTGYSTGDVLHCNPGDANAAKIPTGFTVTVGPYPEFSVDSGLGITTTTFGVALSVSFATSGGVTTATAATPFLGLGTWYGTAIPPAVVNDPITPSAAFYSISGATFKVGSITNNPSSGDKIDANGDNSEYHFPFWSNNTTGSNLAGYYNGTLGGTATTDGFLAAVANNNKTNWDPNLTANGANTFIRAGFGIGSITPPPTQILMPQICM